VTGADGPRVRPSGHPADRPVSRDAPDIPPRTARALQRRVFSWYAEHRRDLPWRRTTDPYAVLVSEVMLQQTQVSRVIPAFERWMARYPTLETLAGAQLRDVLAEWSGLGYNNRAERLRRTAQSVTAAARGAAALPTTMDALRRLPGIGPYTARAVLIFAHDADLAAVDANVRRVLTHELALPHDLSPAAVQAVADAVLPKGRARDWHNALMDYGALVLTGRATGIRAPRRQTPYEGSRRWYRARTLRLLLEHGALDLPELAEALGLCEDDTGALVALLERDGLVCRSGARVALA
jgi:A/G-specific adenine glycosylase